MPKVYSDAVSYESMFYFILKYHERYFSHLLKEIHQTLRTANNSEGDKHWNWHKTDAEVKKAEDNFHLKAWGISKTSTESIWVGGYDHREGR